MLSIWHQIGFWGAIATFAGLIIAVIFFLLGPTKSNQKKELRRLGKIGEDTSEIKGDLTKIVEMLRDELSIKEQIEFLQGEAERVRDVTPSERALELAQKIPDDAGPYALALKAIAERRFKDACQFLDEAQKRKEIELSEIYRAHGMTEFYAGIYVDAANWYEKALELSPDNPVILNDTGVAFLNCAKYAEAEPLIRRALEIDEKSFGSEHPNVSRNLNNLAELLRDTGRFEEAEPMYRRALEIDEKSFGSEHQNVAIRLNNLALLLQDTNRPFEAETMYKRVVKIFEKSLGPNHPNIATSLNNLAVLLQATNRLAEAEPLMLRALRIDEKSFGKNHTNVARDLNNLAQLLRVMNRFSEAEPLTRRALEIFEKSLGPDHPRTQTVRRNLEMLKKRISRQ